MCYDMQLGAAERTLHTNTEFNCCVDFLQIKKKQFVYFSIEFVVFNFVNKHCFDVVLIFSILFLLLLLLCSWPTWPTFENLNPSLMIAASLYGTPDPKSG